MEAFWCYVGCILGPSWAHLGLMLGSCWAHVGLMLGSCWLCWVHVGTMLEHLGTLGAVLEHLATTFAVKAVKFKKCKKFNTYHTFGGLELPSWSYVGAMLLGLCWAMLGHVGHLRAKMEPR